MRTLAWRSAGALRARAVRAWACGHAQPFTTPSGLPNPSDGLTDTQRELQQLAYAFGRDELGPHSRTWDREKHFPIETLRRGAALGFGGLCVSDERGGSGLSRTDTHLVFEALAFWDVPVSAYLSIHNMVATMMDRHGSDTLRAEVLPALASMDALGAYCLTEPGSGSDAAALQTGAVRDGAHYVLSGTKAFISGAGVADWYLVMARTDDSSSHGISCFAVPRDAPGLTFGTPEHKMGWNAQPTALVYLDGVRVPETHRLGAEGRGFAIAMEGLDGGRINIATMSLGAAQRAVELTREHLLGRTQFGRPLAAFQAPAFMYADMLTRLTTSRLLIRAAAAKLDARAPDASQYCAMAKAHATEECYRLLDSALQLFGGYGYIQDTPIEQLYRDCRVHRILEGTTQIMQMIVSNRALPLPKDTAR